MSYTIKHLFHIDVTKEKVFQAISTLEGLRNWWTVQVEGSTEIERELKFTFGDFGGPTMMVMESSTNQKVVWRCIDKEHSWYQHEYTFLLDENDGKCRLRFSHSGWEENGDFYASCCFSWGRYLESMRQYCQTGKGHPFGSEGF